MLKSGSSPDKALHAESVSERLATLAVEKKDDEEEGVASVPLHTLSFIQPSSLRSEPSRAQADSQVEPGRSDGSPPKRRCLRWI